MGTVHWCLRKPIRQPGDVTTFLLVLYHILFVYWLLLLARLVVGWCAPSLAVAAHRYRGGDHRTVFTATDPPIKLLRRLIPPIPLGPVRLDLSLMIVMIVVIVAMRIAQGAAELLGAALALAL